MIVAILSSCSTTSSLLVVVWWSCQSTTQQACTTHEYKLYSIALHRTHSAYNDVEWDGISGAIVLAYIYSNINDTNNIIEVEPDATQMIFPNTPIHIYWSFVLFSYCIYCIAGHFSQQCWNGTQIAEQKISRLGVFVPIWPGPAALNNASHHNNKTPTHHIQIKHLA